MTTQIMDRGTSVPSKSLAQVRATGSAWQLVDRGDRDLAAANRTSDPAERFTFAHVAALRYAGAVLAARPLKPRSVKGRSAWQQLAKVEPDLATWAAYFNAGAPLRAGIESGRMDAVSPEQAEEWVASAQDFAFAVCDLLTRDADALVVASSARAS